MRQVLLIIDVQPSFNPPARLVDRSCQLRVELWRHHFGKVLDRDQVIATLAS